jgi:hypothetical protein
MCIIVESTIFFYLVLWVYVCDPFGKVNDPHSLVTDPQGLVGGPHNW